MAQGDDGVLKVVLVGDGGVGKSALLWVFMNNEFKVDYIPTVVDAYTVYLSYSTHRCQLEIIDTAGQEDFTQLRLMSLRGAHIVVTCYSCARFASIRNVKYTWEPEARQLNKDVTVLLVGTKEDLFVPNYKEHVSPRMANKLAIKIKAYAALRCSSLQFAQTEQRQGNINDVFKVVLKAGLISKGILEDEREPNKGFKCTMF